MRTVSFDRRSFCQIAAGGFLTLLRRPCGAADLDRSSGPIPALLPRDEGGHHFVLYSDCCSGTAGTRNARNLQAVNGVVSRIDPMPEFIAFPGDAIMGLTDDYTELRRQWDYWLDHEMAWLRERNLTLYQSTSNHHTYDAGSERVFREVHPELPQNGPPGQQGLAYFVRRGNLLYVSTHQPDQRQLIDYAWLSQVFREHADCRYKFVAGHYPVFPVNGYLAWPSWCFPPPQRRPFWDILVEHKVDAYLASHIIAFDVQVHDGILQILSGGAGTNYGPGGFMPGTSEDLHAVQLAVDRQGLRYQVRDTEGNVREQLSWPMAIPVEQKWREIDASSANEVLSSADWSKAVVALQISGKFKKQSRIGEDQTILCGIDASEGVEPIWIGIDGDSGRLLVRVVPQAGHGWQVWKGPLWTDGAALNFQVAFHPGMGPGGILYRPRASAPWSTLAATSSKGVEDLKPPVRWTVGHSQSGETDRPFVGPNLRVRFWHHALTEC